MRAVWRGVLARELAQLLAVTSDAIARWESDEQSADRSTLATIGALVLDALADQTGTRDRLRAIGMPDPALRVAVA